MAPSCRLCETKEEDPRRLIHTSAFIPRYGRKKQFVPVHVECYLGNGGDIARLTDRQLWHVSTETLCHFGLIDDGREEYALLKALEHEAAPARIATTLAGAAGRRTSTAMGAVHATAIATTGSRGHTSVVPSKTRAQRASLSRDLSSQQQLQKGPSTSLRSARDDGGVRGATPRQLRRAA